MPIMSNGHLAYIDSRKLSYLFDVKKGKGWNFAYFGVTVLDAEWLERELLSVAANAEYVLVEERAFGVCYTFYEMLITPDGIRMPTFSSWQTNYGESAPHLNTAYPRSQPYKGKRL